MEVLLRFENEVVVPQMAESRRGVRPITAKDLMHVPSADRVMPDECKTEQSFVVMQDNFLHSALRGLAWIALQKAIMELQMYSADGDADAPPYETPNHCRRDQPKIVPDCTEQNFHIAIDWYDCNYARILGRHARVNEDKWRINALYASGDTAAIARIADDPSDFQWQPTGKKGEKGPHKVGA